MSFVGNTCFLEVLLLCRYIALWIGDYSWQLTRLVSHSYFFHRLRNTSGKPAQKTPWEHYPYNANMTRLVSLSKWFKRVIKIELGHIHCASTELGLYDLLLAVRITILVYIPSYWRFTITQYCIVLYCIVS